jgi:hypothetical protein
MHAAGVHLRFAVRYVICAHEAGVVFSVDTRER